MQTIELQLYGEISPFYGDINAASVAQALQSVAPDAAIAVRLHSPGGSPFEAIAIHSMLARHKGPKTIYVDGLAASAASVLAMVPGASVVMGEGSMMMIHRAEVLHAEGRADAMDARAEMLRAIDEQTAQMYARRSKQPIETVREMMNAETWLDPASAVSTGFADRVEKGPIVKQAFDLGKFRNVPTQITRNLTQNPASRYGADMSAKEIRSKLGLAETATDAEVMAALDTAVAQRAPAPAAAPPAAPIATPIAPDADVAQIVTAVVQALTKPKPVDPAAALAAHTATCSATVERLIAARKIAPAMREKAIAACGSTAETLAAAVAYWEAAPEVVPAPIPLTCQNGEPQMSAHLAAMVKQAGVNPKYVLEVLAEETH